MRLYPQLHALLLVSAACGSPTGLSLTGGGGGNMPSGSAVGVIIQDFSFSPAAVTVKVGTTVKWTNNGPAAHTTTSNTGTWDSGQLSGPTSGGPYGGSAGGTYQYRFTTAGTYAYHCSNHPPSTYPGFTGTVTVTAWASWSKGTLSRAPGGVRYRSARRRAVRVSSPRNRPR